MKKNAFTLTELLAVIVILSIVSLIAVPNLINSIKSNNKDNYESVINDIILSAESYANNVGGVLKQIPVSKLKEEGYLPNNIVNPIDNTSLNGCVYVVGGDTI